MAAAANWSPMSDSNDRDWGRDLLMRLLDGIKEDLAKLSEAQGDDGKTARAAFLRVEQVEVKVAQLEAESRRSEVSLAEIKALSKAAGYMGGAITGVLSGILTAFVIRMLHL